MASIPRRYLDNYQSATLALKRQAMEELARAISNVDVSDMDTARWVIIDLMQAMCGAYADAAATLAAQYYTLSRRAAIGGDFEAVAESGREPIATRIACLGIIDEYNRNGDLVSMITQLLLRIEYEISEACAQCMFANMEIDPYRGE